MNVANIYSKLAYSIFRAYGLIHPIQKKVVFSSFFGKQYSDNPKAICDEMHRLYPDYELVWLLNNKNVDILPDYVRAVSQSDSRFAWGKEIATAASYVYNVENKTRIYRNSRQSFIQTWHGDRAIKKVLKDRNPNLVLYDDELTTLCVSGSESGTGLYKSAFGYNGKIMGSGCPRNDCLLHVNQEKIQRVKELLNIPQDGKVLLYAPTFRDNNKEKPQNANVNVQRTLDAYPADEKWICLVRAHIASAGLSGDFTDNRIYDVSAYPDMADILCVTDFLISDYSSCATDFTITGKPIILALFDKEEYQQECRKFFADPEQAGFIIADNQEELENIIRTTTQQQYQEACDRVNKYYGVTEIGHSAEDVCHYIDSYYREHFGK